MHSGSIAQLIAYSYWNLLNYLLGLLDENIDQKFISSMSVQNLSGTSNFLIGLNFLSILSLSLTIFDIDPSF
jgi:hypothetical protein